jgi:DNA-binding LacI/PurR family transcriptional regulator
VGPDLDSFQSGPARLLRCGDFHRETGYTEALALLRLAEPPTAICAGSDQQASGTYEAIRNGRQDGPAHVRRRSCAPPGGQA